MKSKWVLDMVAYWFENVTPPHRTWSRGTNINILQGLSFWENWFINNASRSLKDFGHVERHNVLERT